MGTEGTDSELWPIRHGRHQYHDASERMLPCLSDLMVQQQEMMNEAAVFVDDSHWMLLLAS